MEKMGKMTLHNLSIYKKIFKPTSDSDVSNFMSQET